ncbi:cell surface elastin binding protein EbpS [Bifidobacterium anseris]|uniref:Cell surface elastin binding protein EbpS n=1 Tax=Bifidobacterium anseris TaxID=2020963 RepID=A0A2N5J2L8_9BIFI|nr:MULTISPECIES: DUF6466 family protein [Bifidobacterium]PLS28470.1 cell surface elastin binding protein EbpS [Bifidobacterium anseris]
MSKASSNNATSKSTRRPRRLPLAARIVLLVVAVAAVVVAVWSLWNVHATAENIDATATLTRTIDEAAKPDADFKRLLAQQRQTDARYDALLDAKATLLPELVSNVERNARTSKTLTGRLEESLAQQERDKQSQDAGGTTTQNAERGADPALDEQEQRKLEELLKNNEPTEGDASTSTQDGKRTQQGGTAGSQDAKPW